MRPSPETVFCYRAKEDQDELLALFDGSKYTLEDQQYLERSLKGLSALFFHPKCQVFPFSGEPDAFELDAREHFRSEDWLLVGEIVKSVGIKNFLIVHRSRPDYAFVIDGRGFQIVFAIYGNFAVYDPDEDRNILGSEFLRKNGITPESGASIKKTPVNLGYAKQEIPEEEEEVDQEEINERIRTGFVSNSKKTIRNLGVAKSLLPEKEEEEVGPIDLSSFQATFQGNSKKKPGKILNSPKPKQEKKIPENKPTLVRKPLEENKPYQAPTLQNIPFQTGGAKPKKIIVEPSNHWIAGSYFSFRRSRVSISSLILVNDPTNPKARVKFKGLDETLLNIARPTLSPRMVFVPEIPEKSDPVYGILKNFHPEDWRILAAAFDAYDRVELFLLSYREDPYKCIVLSNHESPQIYAFSTIGMSIEHPSLSFEEVLARCEAPKEEKPVIRETPIEVEETAEERIEEEIPVKKVKRTPQRRVFVTRRFQNCAEKFENKYHEGAKKDLEELYQELILDEKEVLDNYFKAKDSKTFKHDRSYHIHKFRFGSSKQYDGARVFYLRGYDDVGRQFKDDDIILLYLTDDDEHDNQGEIARSIERTLKKNTAKSSMILHQILFPIEEEEESDLLAYPSVSQFKLLEEGRLKLPHAYVGSAGTGKTLLSLLSTLEIGKDNQKVLYLTYERELCNFAAKKFEELGAESVMTMTFRDLVRYLFGDESANEMEDKRHFRTWFDQFVDRNSSIRNRLSLLGGGREDQFLVAYVFYRGVLEGNADSPEGKEDILSEEEFLSAVSGEEGFDLEGKKLIYQIAFAYQKHLKEIGRTTDNRLARRILADQERLRQFDAIVIDEYQDLTEIQFLAILSLLKPTRPLQLYIYGDDNQAINPTIFELGRARNLVRRFFKDATLYTSDLNDSYRSGPNLVRYINQMKDITRESIGSRGLREEQKPEVSKREDNEDVFVTLVRSQKDFGDLVTLVSTSAKDAVFIFPSAVARDKAIAKYKKFGEGYVTHSFLSVEQAKGREWGSVILVDFFTSSKEVFDAMLGDEKAGKKSTLHRMLFNRFYVALTRAKNRIVVFESAPSKLIDERILSGLNHFADTADLKSYFKGNIDPLHWVKEGDRRFEAGNYREAIRAYSRCGDIEEAKEKSQLSEAYLRAEEREMDSKEIVTFYAERMELDKLQDFYHEDGKQGKRTLLENLRDPEGDLQACAEGFLQLKNGMEEAERTLFFYLLEKRFSLTINKSISKLHKK